MTRLFAQVPMSGTVQIITAVGAILSPLVTLWIGYLIRRSQDREKTRAAEIALEVEKVRLAAIEAAGKVELVRLAAEQTAARVEEVRQETERTTHRVEEVKEVLDETARSDGEKFNNLVSVSSESLAVSREALRRGNGALGRVLRHTAELARWKADHDPTDPAAVRAAELAERDYAEHQAEQAEQAETARASV